MTTRARKDAENIYVRDTEFGPELVFDYGIQATVVGLTGNDADRVEQVLRARRENRQRPRA